MIESMIRYLLGPDVFISYARADASVYAGRLALQLQGLQVYLDQVGSPPGRIVPPRVLKQVSRSSVLVVIASPYGLQSSAVGQEVALFPSERRPLIPISFAERDDVLPWGERVSGLAVERDSLANLHAGLPPERIAERIRLAVGNQRQAQRLRRTGLVVVTWLAIGIITLGLVIVRLKTATLNLRVAEAKFANVSSRQVEAERKLGVARADLEAVQNRLRALQALSAAQARRLTQVRALASREERRARDQAAATVQLWEAIDTGIQSSSLYPQPDLSCREGRLSLDPPLTVYFAWDEVSLSDGARESLVELTRCYRQQAVEPELLILGHCSITSRREGSPESLATDVLGGQTNEYALALAQRMADAVRSYLESLGVPPDKMLTISYGEERPKYNIPLMDNRVEVMFSARRESEW